MPHILIVEDEPAIAETLVYACQDAGLQTRHCLLGGEAVATIKAEPFDFVVLDVGLPDINGFEVCKQIRQFSNVPVLFLTARNHEIDRIVGLEIGADDYVAKPFSPREIVARIKAILRRGQPQDSVRAEPVEAQSARHPIAHDFALDETACRIQYRDTWLHLTRYEFGLLKALMQHPTRIYSRAQLMDLVWTDAEDTLERTVDAHIKTLRAKLREIDAQCEAVITHRGMGYSLLK